MNNQIIKMNIKVQTTKAGGGKPTLKTPKNIHNLFKLQNYLKTIKEFSIPEIFKLNHQVFIDKEGNKSTIPAVSNRFIDAMTMIFGDNEITPLETRYNHKNERLDFLYYILFENVEKAILRIENIIEVIEILKKTNNSSSIEELFGLITKEAKQESQKIIKKYAKKKELKIFSYTKFCQILSGQEHVYESFKLFKEQIIGNSFDETEIHFVSMDSKKQGLLVLQNQRMNILYEDDFNLIFQGKFEGTLNGVINSKFSAPKNVSIEKPLTRTHFLEKAFYEKFKLTEEEKISTKLGVIDGGISIDSIIRKELEECLNPSDIGFDEPAPHGNHAENVCSILLWANKLSNKTKDNLDSPSVSLFNVISKQDTITTFKTKVKKIIQENAHNIKIWNICISFAGEKTDEILSQLGVFLDGIQANYDVLIFVPTGNLDDEDNLEIINAPSGSFKSISVSSINSKNQPTSYTKKGYGKYLNQKPDFAIFGGDEKDEIKVISNNVISRSNGGTSFATPLAVRKATTLLEMGFSILEIPAILNAYASWYSINNNIEITNMNGNGVIPVDSTEMFNLINKNTLVTMKISLSKDYRQGFFKLKLPKFENKYDVNIIASININGTLAKYLTYEYVLDSSTFAIGRVDPFTQKMIDETKPIKDYGYKDGRSESALRIYKGKFKTRNIKKSIIKRARTSIKTNLKEKKTLEIENWGIKFVRNTIGLNRKQINNQEVAVCIIFSSKNYNFFNEFINMNKILIENYNEIININNNIIDSEIEFI